MLRRTKAVVMGEEIPPREELTVFIPLTDTQRFWTYRLLTKMDTPNLLNIFSDRPGIKLEDDENASQGRGEDVSSSEIVAAVDGIVERNRNALIREPDDVQWPNAFRMEKTYESSTPASQDLRSVSDLVMFFSQIPLPLQIVHIFYRTLSQSRMILRNTSWLLPQN